MQKQEFLRINKITTITNKTYSIGDCFPTYGASQDPLFIDSIILLDKKKEIYLIELVGKNNTRHSCRYFKKVDGRRFIT